MAARANIDDIVYNEIVQHMDLSVTVKSATAPASNGEKIVQTVVLCNQKWLKLFNIMVQVTIVDGEAVENFWVVDPNSYQADGSFVVFQPYDDAALKQDDELIIQIPFYFRGTQRATNFEWNKASMNFEMLPMIWLCLSPALRQSWKNESSSLDRESDLRLFFLCRADFVNDWTKDHIVKWIEPLNAIVDEFIATCQRRTIFLTSEMEWTTWEYPRFGKETKDGIETNIIDCTLSGVELRLSLPILKGDHCNC